MWFCLDQFLFAELYMGRLYECFDKTEPFACNLKNVNIRLTKFLMRYQKFLEMRPIRMQI